MKSLIVLLILGMFAIGVYKEAGLITSFAVLLNFLLVLGCLKNIVKS